MLSRFNVARGVERKGNDMGLLRNLSIILALGILANIGVLMVSGPIAGGWKPSNTPIPDPSPQPCSKQSWHNADRICLTWTKPRNEKSNVAMLATDLKRGAALAR
jgi:hypothetical protein